MDGPIDQDRPTRLLMAAIPGKEENMIEMVFMMSYLLSLSLSFSTCTSTGVSACTERACPPPTCVDENGNRYSIGQSFPAADGCNNW